MKNLVYAIVVVALLIGAIGFYRGWLDVRKSEVPGQDRVEVGVSIDRAKARGDLDTAKGKVEELGAQVKEKTQELGTEVKEKSQEIREDSRDRAAAEPTEPRAAATDATLTGTISSVDASSRTMKVSTGTGETDVTIEEGAPISVDGRPGDLASLKVGDRVTILLGKDSPTHAIDVDVFRS